MKNISRILLAIAISASLAACDSAAVIGAPFYVMERARGVILRDRKPPPGVTSSGKPLPASS